MKIDQLQNGAMIISFDGRSFIPVLVSKTGQRRMPVVEIVTSLGRTACVNWDHQCLTSNGLVQANKLSTNDSIAVPVSLPFFGNVAVPDYVAGFLGLWLAEGSSKATTPIITTKIYGIQVANFANSFGCVARNKERRNGKTPSYQMSHSSRGGVAKINPIQAMLRLWELDNCTSATKHIPEQAFSWNRHSVATLLHWLFNGDGWLCRRKQSDQRNYSFELGFVSKSYQLVNDVSHLLLRFGIVGRIRQRSRSNCWIWTTRRYEEISRFVSFIGIDREDAALVPFHDPQKGKRVFGVVEYDPVVAISMRDNWQMFDIAASDLRNFVANDIIVYHPGCGHVIDASDAIV
ncbi:MAG: hypothetical protein IAE79_02615 [Anaerolinea sp.]|nr:hypothetical protein [Anaerolinea sp.]